MNIENLQTLKIHKLTQTQYDRELAAGNIKENEIYLTPDEKIEIPTKVSELENDSGFITDDKIPEIAEQAASLIDAQLASLIGSGVLE